MRHCVTPLNLTVAIDGRGIRFLIRGLQQDFEKFWCGGVVMLSVTEKLLQILLQKPVEIADPVQPLGMHDHAESRIGQEGAASGSRFRSLPSTEMMASKLPKVCRCRQSRALAMRSAPL